MNGLTCAIGSDCTSRSCVGGVCAAPSCTDGVRNGTETAIDCGGTCPPCFVCPARLAPTDDPGATAQTLVMSEINPGTGGYIELYNDSDTPLALSTSPHQLCSPFVYVALATLGAGITVPARGYALVPWPASFADLDAGGELQLYDSAAFGNSASIVDFVCWGTNPHGTRMAQAFTAGKWSSNLASSCAPALTGGAIHRRIGTDGVDAADYDTSSAPSPVACTP
jgi:hypothetical protein